MNWPKILQTFAEAAAAGLGFGFFCSLGIKVFFVIFSL